VGTASEEVETVVEVRELERGAGTQAFALRRPVVWVPSPLVYESSAHGEGPSGRAYMKPPHSEDLPGDVSIGSRGRAARRRDPPPGPARDDGAVRI